MCDNHRECEAARRQGFGGPPESGGRHSGPGGQGGGHRSGHGHGLEWHGEWRGQEIVRSLLDSLGVEVTMIDAEDRIVAFSGGARLFPRTDELLGTSVLDAHAPHGRDAVREMLDALKRGERVQARETALPDGGRALTEYFARRDAEGRYLGVMQLSRRIA